MITEDTYGIYDKAYEYLNKNLFFGELPNVLITLKRMRGNFGSFHRNSFINVETGEKICEISLNPEEFKNRTNKEVLSTLAHEMVHFKQFIMGDSPPKSEYHNIEWATMMKDIGLYPSDTGKPDGKETGRKVSHYIIQDGKFDKIAEEFLKMFTLIEYQGVVEAPKEKKKNLSKFVCPSCGQFVLGKEQTSVICNNCHEKMATID